MDPSPLTHHDLWEFIAALFRKERGHSNAQCARGNVQSFRNTTEANHPVASAISVVNNP